MPGQGKNSPYGQVWPTESRWEGEGSSSSAQGEAPTGTAQGEADCRGERQVQRAGVVKKTLFQNSPALLKYFYPSFRKEIFVCFPWFITCSLQKIGRHKKV